MVGREPSGIRRIDRDGEAAFGKKTAGGLKDLGGAGAAVAVAQDDISPASSTAGAHSRGHGMAIHKEIAAEQRFRFLDEPV